MKLQLEINSRAINDKSRALEGSGVMITPPIDENFWLMRVKVSEEQAIVGFPKFGVIGIGFQHETDWNTNLPSGQCAFKIYEHIKRNKGDAKIPKLRCIEAIALIQKKAAQLDRAATIEKLGTSNDTLEIVGGFLRRQGFHQVAEAFGK